MRPNDTYNTNSQYSSTRLTPSLIWIDIVKPIIYTSRMELLSRLQAEVLNRKAIETIIVNAEAAAFLNEVLCRKILLKDFLSQCARMTIPKGTHPPFRSPSHVTYPEEGRTYPIVSGTFPIHTEEFSFIANHILVKGSGPAGLTENIIQHKDLGKRIPFGFLGDTDAYYDIAQANAFLHHNVRSSVPLGILLIDPGAIRSLVERYWTNDTEQENLLYALDVVKNNGDYLAQEVRLHGTRRRIHLIGNEPSDRIFKDPSMIHHIYESLNHFAEEIRSFPNQYSEIFRRYGFQQPVAEIYTAFVQAYNRKQFSHVMPYIRAIFNRQADALWAMSSSEPQLLSQYLSQFAGSPSAAKDVDLLFSIYDQEKPPANQTIKQPQEALKTWLYTVWNTYNSLIKAIDLSYYPKKVKPEDFKPSI